MSSDDQRELTAEIGGFLLRICEVPAPPFGEQARAELLQELWSEAGLRAELDELGNVFADTGIGSGPRVLLAAHSDTVFPEGTDVTVQRAGERWLAPGVGDNSSSLAVLTCLAGRLGTLDADRLPRLSLAAPVGEEGRGDLRGMRRLLADREGQFDYVVAVDGQLGSIVDRAVGSKRFEFRFSARGGHSWGDYPAPSAIHAAAEAMGALNGLEVPDEPRSSWNIGTMRGGTAINAIAQEAVFDLDLRSLDPGILAALERSALSLVEEAARRHRVGLETVNVGDRPAASSDNAELVRAARTALEEHGLEARTAAGSTDANASMALGIPSISFGVYRGGDAHRLSEWIEPASLGQGYLVLLSLLEGLARLRA